MGPGGGELERLREELDEARQQLAATTDVLTTVGRSTSDSGDVLDSLVASACQLIHADIAQIQLIEGDTYRLASSSGNTKEYVDFVARHPMALDRSTLVGRVGLERRAQTIADVLADSNYGRRDLQQIAGYRSILGVPMILDDEVIGVLSAWRTEVNPFSDRAVEVLTTFAAQAAIVIRNFDLVARLEARQQELAARVDQLVALGEIGQAVSSSLDLNQVLTKIVTHAVQLTDADGGSIFEFDEFSEEFNIRTTFGTADETVEAFRALRITLDETLVGRAAVEQRSLQVPDLNEVDLDAHLQVLLDHGWFSVIAVPIFRDHEIVGALVLRRRTRGGFSDDVSELLETFAGQSAIAIVNARLFRELADVSRHKTEFLASMSHELRTPLNAVIGFSQVLLERSFGDINDKQEEYIRDILQSGEHLLELLNDILDLAKVEAGHMELNVTVFEVRQAIERGIQMVQGRASRRNVRISLDIADDVGTVQADQLRFKQVVLNLLSNAVKFTRSLVAVSAWTDGTTLTVSVADDGLGIAKEDFDVIFEAFQQGTRPSREEGTGLGLTLSKQIVELHSGEISLESEVGTGSTFTFTIPMTSSLTQSEESAAQDLPSSGPVVAIVEDDARSLDLLCLYVGKVGVEVATASDGRLGLEMIRRIHPAAVVLDIQLPTLDGWDLLASLKADPSTAAIPVVVVSMLDERNKGLALGAAEYLVKPVRGDEVRAALARVAGLVESRKLLISVGEDSEVVESLRVSLEPEGWTVLHAGIETDGAQLKAQRPAVIVLDLPTTGTSGLALLEALHSDPQTAQVPIIALTSQTMTAADKERLRGQIKYVNRNGEFDISALVDVVHRATHHLAPSQGDAP